RAQPLAHQARIPEHAAQPRQWMLYDTLARALERLIALEHPEPSARSEQAPRPLERSRERFLARGAVDQHRREGFSEAHRIAIARPRRDSAPCAARSILGAAAARAPVRSRRSTGSLRSSCARSPRTKLAASA